MAKSGFTVKKNVNNAKTEAAKIQKAIEESCEKVALQFQADVQAVTHVDTGALRRSWTGTTQKDGNKVRIICGSNISYAPMEDSLHPNLSYIHQKNADSYFKTIADDIKAAGGGK